MNTEQERLASTNCIYCGEIHEAIFCTDLSDALVEEENERITNTCSNCGGELSEGPSQIISKVIDDSWKVIENENKKYCSINCATSTQTQKKVDHSSKGLCVEPTLQIPNTERKGDQTPGCNVCEKPFIWEDHYQVAVWNADEWEVETFWAHIKCYAMASYSDHIKELGKVRVTYPNGKGKFEIMEGE